MASTRASGASSTDHISPAKTGAKTGGRFARPTQAQRRYLERGVNQPGGKLPLFDTDGQEIPRKTIESCIQRGWAAPWYHNSAKPDWLVCRLTEAGYRLLQRTDDKSSTEGSPRS